MTSLARQERRRKPVDFAAINSAALATVEPIVRRWLPDGRRSGREWIARNPTRSDRRAGSFKVNLSNGRWADFATGDKGGDVISLAAYLFGLSQSEAARKIADMLAISSGARR